MEGKDFSCGGRKFKRVVLSPWGFPLMFKTGAFSEVISGLPEGALFRGYTIDPLTNLLSIFFEHDSFDEIPEGAEIPAMRIDGKTYYGKELLVLRKLISNST